MRPSFLLAVSLLVFFVGACASTVVPDLGDAGRADVPIDTPITVDVVERVDVPPSCADFQTLCSGRCVDTSTDPGNCGGCGRACPSGACSAGSCAAACLMPRLMCNGRCIDPSSDSSNCGGCGIACGDSTCVGGMCRSTCSPGFAVCGTRCVDVLLDPANCGGCDRVCPTVAGGMAVCAMGTCAQLCMAGRLPCGGQCVDTTSDASNCGACGNACPTGVSCVGSTCRTSMRPPPGAYPIPFAPLEATGTSVANGDDVTSGFVPLGFTFRFFTGTYTQVNISSNGLIGFDPSFGAACCQGLPIPRNDMTNNVIAAAWTDLYPPGSPRTPNAVTWETRGTAPNRIFVVSWTDVPWCCMGVPRVTTQIVLHETTDAIEIFTTMQNAGHMYTQGAEFIPGRVAADYALMNDGVLIYTN